MITVFEYIKGRVFEKEEFRWELLDYLITEIYPIELRVETRETERMVKEISLKIESLGNKIPKEEALDLYDHLYHDRKWCKWREEKIKISEETKNLMDKCISFLEDNYGFNANDIPPF